MTQTQPAKPSALNQLFRDLREKFRQKVLKHYELPWMKSKELDILIEILTRLSPRRVFEWGSGFSTVYFPKYLQSLELWYSVEHHKDWYDQIVRLNSDNRVEIIHIPPDRYDFTKASGKYSLDMEGSYDEFRQYVDYPDTLSIKFDFIFIDGRARKECLRKAFDLIDDNGLVILHDANRINYLQEIPPFRNIVFFQDYRRVRGGMLIAAKNRDLSSVLDLKAHQRAWKYNNVIAKIFFMG